MKPIQQAFKFAQAVLCVANEWRDSLSYGLGTPIAGAEFLLGHHWALPVFLGAVALREWGRYLAWFFHPFELRLAGDNAPLIDNEKNGAAANIVANGFVFGCGITSSIIFSAPAALGGTAIAAFSGLISYALLADRDAGPRDIPKIYLDPISGTWDWPRKNKDDGPTQTQKLKDWADGKIKAHRARRALRPGFGATGNLIPVQVKANVAPR